MGIWPDYYHVKRSLSQSPLRIRILLFLYRRECACSVGEIARGVKILRPNVMGALNGDGVVYRASNSLVSIGLVCRIETGVLSVSDHYRLTPQGFNVARLLKRHGPYVDWTYRFSLNTASGLKDVNVNR